MRRERAWPIGDVLREVVEKLEQTKNKDIFKIFSAWPSVVGKGFARHTKPVSLRSGTLKVFVDESAWFYQVNLQKEKLLKSLQRKIGTEKIQKIQFRIGQIR